MYQIHYFFEDGSLMRVSNVIFEDYIHAILHLRKAVTHNPSLPVSRRFSYAQIVDLIVC